MLKECIPLGYSAFLPFLDVLHTTELASSVETHKTCNALGSMPFA
jgi:hypothetical protein